jgi:transglutaminase-like putative cysteine protease
MRALVRKGRQSQVVRSLALSLVKGLQPKDYWGEASAIHAFVRDRIRYVRDIRGVETLHTAEQILAQGQGDCDDKSILAAALLEAVGARTQLKAVGFNQKSYCHVYPQFWLAGRWWDVETTEPWPLGKGPDVKPVIEMVRAI